MKKRLFILILVVIVAYFSYGLDEESGLILNNDFNSDSSNWFFSTIDADTSGDWQNTGRSGGSVFSATQGRNKAGTGDWNQTFNINSNIINNLEDANFSFCYDVTSYVQVSSASISVLLTDPTPTTRTLWTQTLSGASGWTCIYVNATNNLTTGGNYNLILRQVIDLGNNVDANVTSHWDDILLNLTYTVDSTAPTINLTYPLNTTYTSNVSELKYTASDDKSLNNCWYSFDNGETNSSTQTCGTNWTTLESLEGNNTWFVYASDASGNEDSSNVSFFKDTVYPLIDYGAITEVAYYNVSRDWIYVNVSVTELNEESIVFFLYDSTTIYNSSYHTDSTRDINWTGLSDGTYTYNVTINDTIGNVNFTLERDITLDNAPPYFIDIANQSIYDNESANLNINASDAIGVECFSVNETSIFSINCTGFLENITILEVKRYNLNISVNDSANNINSSIIYVNVSSSTTDDVLAPSVTLLLPVDYQNLSDTSVLFNCSSSDSGDGLKNSTLYGNWTGSWLENETEDITGVSNWTNFTNNIGEGTYEWNCYVCDQADNCAFTSENWTFTVDTTFPTINLTSPLNTSYSTNVSDLTYTSSDVGSALDVCWYSLDEGDTNSSTQTCGTNWTTLESVEGSNTWFVYVNDSSGNQNMSNVSFFKDTVYPLIDYGVITEVAYYNVSRDWIYVNVSVTELNEESIVFFLYDSTTIYNSSYHTDSTRDINWTGLSDGTYTYNVTINDTLGNVNFTLERDITLDNAAPTINISYPLNTTYSTNVSELKYTSYDGSYLTGCWYTQDNGETNSSTQTCGTNWTTLESLEGNNTWFVYANDSFSNENSYNVSFFKDTVYPLIDYGAITEVAYYNVSRDWIYVNVSANDTNEESIVFFLYDSTTIYNSSYHTDSTRDINWTGLSDGTYTYNVTINDTIGNVNFTLERDITLDNAPPYFTNLANQSIAEINSLSYDIDATDDGVGLDCFTVNDTTNFGINCTGGLVNVTGLSKGNFYVNITVNDSLNILNSSIILINVTEVDLTAPTITITSPLNQTYTTNSILFDVTALDGISIDSCLYSLDGATNSTMTQSGNSWSDTNSSMTQGDHRVDFYCNDTSNNLNNSEKEFIFIDSIYPLIDFVSPVSSSGNYSQNFIEANVTVTDTNLDTIFIYLYNSTGLVQSNNSLTSSFFVNFTGLDDGTYYLNATSNDSVNNFNFTSTRMIVLDSTIPNINITSPLNTTYATNVSDLDYTTDGYYCWYSLDEGDTNSSVQSCLSNWTTLESVEGSNTWGVYVNDSSGNQNMSKVSFFKDTIYPLVDYGVITEVDDYNVSRDWIYVNVSANDTNEDSIVFFLYDSTTIYNSSYHTDSTRDINWTGLSDGTYTYNVTINDTVGNVNITEIRTITLDNIAPTINISYPQNTTYTTNVSELNYVSNGYMCWYSLDNGATNSSVQSCGSNWTTLESTEGSNTWFVYVNDSSGNQNMSNVSFFKDTSYPLIDYGVITEVDYYNVSRDWIYVNVSVTEDNEDSIIFFLYDSTTIYNSSYHTDSTRDINWTGLSDGVYAYNVTINDTLGNVNFTSERTLSLDSGVPEVTIFSPTNTSYLDEDVDLNYSVFDAVLGIESVWYSLDDGSNTSLTGNLTLTPGDGNHKIFVYANDSTGNLNITEFVLFYLNETTEVESDNFGGSSTNFSELTNDLLENITNLTLESSSYGMIIFGENINLSEDTDLDSNIELSDNFISLDSDVLSNLNKSATLYLYNLTFANPRILRNGAICPLTICTKLNYTGNNLSFSVTGFTNYSAEETPGEDSTPSPSGGGGGGSRARYECTFDSDCEVDYSCFNNKCVKLFDVKLIRIDSPVPPKEFLDFTYFIKGMTAINGDVIITFWLEKGNQIVTSGSDTIYFGNLDAKTETTSIFLPDGVEDGTYVFNVEADFQGHKTRSHRTIEVSSKAPLNLNINLLDFPSLKPKDLLNFSFILAFNRDSPSLVKLKEELKKNGETYWLKERDLEVTRSLIVEESVGEIVAGDYNLEIIGYYDDKELKFVKEFSVVKERGYLTIIFGLLIIVCIISLLFFVVKFLRKTKQARGDISKEKEPIERKEDVEEAEVVKEVTKPEPEKVVKKTLQKDFQKPFYQSFQDSEEDTFLKEEKKIEEVIGLNVYLLDNRKIGKINEVYIRGHKIRAWMIKLNKKTRWRVGHKKILVKHHHVISIERGFYLGEEISKQIEDHKKNIKLGN